jgi:hypothetical protein
VDWFSTSRATADLASAAMGYCGASFDTLAAVNLAIPLGDFFICEVIDGDRRLFTFG